MEDKLVSDILSKGCTSQREAGMVKQIYLELSEVKRFWDVEYFLYRAHQKIYITAKIQKSEKPSLFIPNHVSDATNFQQLKNFASLNSDIEFQGVYIAFIHADSTCVFYKISEGLIQPKKITSKHLVRNDKKIRDTLIRKNRNFIEQSGLYGIPITLNLSVEEGESCSKNDDLKVSEQNISL